MGQIERTRILEAMAEAMAERPASGSIATIADVTTRAGVSSESFAELFPDREACLLAAFDLGVERASTRVVAAFTAEARWQDAIKAGLASFLRFLEEDPVLGALIVFHAMSGGEQVLRRHAEVLASLAAVVDWGRKEIPPGRPEPPIVIAEGVVGAVLAVLQSRMLSHEHDRLLDLFGPLTSIVVLPYLGPTAARRELIRPAPRARVAGELPATGWGMGLAYAGGARLTYRTTRVLRAIGDYPGASNREVAERAGIADEGQMSRLLSRLAAGQLIVKPGEGRTRGAPNSWYLSERGEAVLNEVRASRSGM